jgi:hypothetical protein
MGWCFFNQVLLAMEKNVFEQGASRKCDQSIPQLLSRIEQIGQPEQERFLFGLRKRTNLTVATLACQIQRQAAAGNLDEPAQEALQEFLDEHDGYGCHSALCATIASWCARIGVGLLGVASLLEGRAQVCSDRTDSCRQQQVRPQDPGIDDRACTDACSSSCPHALAIKTLGLAGCCCATAITMGSSNVRAARYPILTQVMHEAPPLQQMRKDQGTQEFMSVEKKTAEEEAV